MKILIYRSAFATMSVVRIVIIFLFATKILALTYDEILNDHDKVQDAPSRKHNNLNILGFLTPWNTRGINVTLNEAERGRLDVASPVTYQVTLDTVEGGHDYDQEFYDTVTKRGARVYPRFLFEHSTWTLEAMQSLARDTETLANRIIAICKDHGFSGAVIEIWQTCVANGALSPLHAPETIKIMRHLGMHLRDANLHTVLVLPPYAQPVPQHGVSSDSIQELSIGYSQFVVMTYDFTTPGSKKPGPMAPSSWMRDVAKFFVTECGLGDKVLLGLNFYGVDFAPRGVHLGGKDRHVVGHEVIKLLTDHKPELLWVDEIKEHAFIYKHEEKKHIVFYPTRESISARLTIAEETGCGGVAIWDLGQGLDHFFEEF